jgi:hypothetical protein
MSPSSGHIAEQNVGNFACSTGVESGVCVVVREGALSYSLITGKANMWLAIANIPRLSF